LLLLLIVSTILGCSDAGTKSGKPQFAEKVSLITYRQLCNEFNHLSFKTPLTKIDSSALELILYIDSLKQQLLSETKQIDPYSIKINYKGNQSDIDSVYSYYSPTMVLIGKDETNPAIGKWTATELRKRLALFRKEILNEYKYPIAFNHIGDEDGYDDSDKIPLLWEISSFYHMPLIECLKTLKNEQVEIKKIAIATSSIDTLKKD
ncbi:MAG TPA: hypothetical protein VK835_11940, partial [Bacteroidia bacterium]|nr:hypothetical protein [Bacteroidia bacterium]